MIDKMQKKLMSHSQIKNSIVKVSLTSKSWAPPAPNLDINADFGPKQSSTFSQISIAIVNSHQNLI